MNFCTTGSTGFIRFTCGAVVADRRAGNSNGAGVLESTLKRPELHIERDAIIAITGADLSPTIDGLGTPSLSFNAPLPRPRQRCAIALAS
jgi:hypothetical protein